jgi:predicted nucleic acid-binding protein
LLRFAILNAGETVTTRPAQFKAGHGLAYADCFAAATSARDGVLVTADAKDFKKIRGLHVLPLPEHKKTN